MSREFFSERNTHKNELTFVEDKEPVQFVAVMHEQVGRSDTFRGGVCTSTMELALHLSPKYILFVPILRILYPIIQC